MKGWTKTCRRNLDAPRSIFMNLIAKQINLPLPYEWRKSIIKKVATGSSRGKTIMKIYKFYRQI